MNRAYLVLLLPAFVAGTLTLSGCNQDAIQISNLSYDFHLNERPYPVDVWNDNPSVGAITVNITTSHSWLKVQPSQVLCPPPDVNGNPTKQSVQIFIDRRNLPVGQHKGTVFFSARRITTRKMEIRVTQPSGWQSLPLRLVNPTARYSSPYLIEFFFALEDEDRRGVVAEPAQFQISAMEGVDDVNPQDTGVHLRRAAARHLKMDLVLDYSQRIQWSPGAIAAMENAAVNILLPALNEDAQVGVVEFHHSDIPPLRVMEFTADHNALREAIYSIQSDIVGGFFRGSRLWDALKMSAESFGAGRSSLEDRYIVLFSDGNDTSSITDRNTAINAAVNRGITVMTVGFGVTVNEANLREAVLRTNGRYFPASAASALGDAFQNIVENLGSQYILRWASLRRDNVGIRPSFTIRLNNRSATHTATTNFVATQHAGSPGDVLKGKLRLTVSYSQGYATAFLRADYVPQNIDAMNIYMATTHPFTVSVVEPANDGLIGGWGLEMEADTALGGIWILLTSPEGYMPFAGFGPMLRFDFGPITDESAPLFDALYVDSSIYAHGQRFVVEGFPSTPPWDKYACETQDDVWE